MLIPNRLILAVWVLMGTAACALAAPQSSVRVTDFGAAGDGKNDDTTAILKALAHVADGGVVHLPAGSYRLSACLNVERGVTLLGEGVRWENSSSRLIVASKGFSAIRLGNACGVKGLAISYPENRDSQNPSAYPPAIELAGINPAVEDIVFDCAWIGVSTAPGGHNSGQGLFRNLTGFVHHVGIHLSGCRDVNRIENVHWFVGGNDHGREAYFRRNRVGFEFGDVDGIVMSSCFIIGAHTFLHQQALKDTPDGKSEPAHSLGYQIQGCWIEDVDEGFVFEGATGFAISNTNILVRKEGTGIRIATDGLYYNASISDVQVRPYSDPIVGIDYAPVQDHVRNRLSVTGCQVVDGMPAIRLGKGRLRATISGNHFIAHDGYPAVQITEGADLFSITGNILSGDIPIGDDSETTASKVVNDNVIEEP